MQLQYPGMSALAAQNPYQQGYIPTRIQYAPQSTNTVMSQNMQWIPVNGIEGAKAHIVQPNITAWLMDNNEPFFYVKSADALGVTSLKVFKFEEVHMENEQKQDYVSREEFSKFAAQMEDALKEVIGLGKSSNAIDGK